MIHGRKINRRDIRMPKPILKAPHYALMAVLLWSSAFVLTPVALREFTSAPLALIRCAVACAIFGCVLAARKALLPRRSDLARFFLAGAAGFGVYTLVFNNGMETLNPTTSCIIVATSPIITALLARAVFKERLATAGWLAIMLAFCGICVMMLWRGAFAVNAGIFWTQAAALSISVFNILQRDLARRYDAIEITAYSFFMGTLPLLLFLPQTALELARADARFVTIAVFLGIFPSAMGYVCWAKALAVTTGTSRVANFMFLTPFLSLVLEFAVLRQVPDTGTFIGGGAILSGLLLFAKAGKKRVRAGMPLQRSSSGKHDSR